ncbi:MAG: hypothetical protein EOO65_00860 [Methanosarcinales archaeon]|nr:MAG: hypothetical protein EOO65_00860 [Methanosarcinales archaeon]
MQAMNTSVLKLPDAFGNILTGFGDMNSSITDSVAQTRNASTALAAYDQVVVAQNMTSVNRTLLYITANRTSNLASLDADALNSELQVVNSVREVQLAPIRQDVARFQYALQGVMISASLLSTLDALGTHVNRLKLSLAATVGTDPSALGSLRILAQGYCDDLQDCAVDADCINGGTCHDKGVSRCRYDKYNNPCTANTDCTNIGGDYCLTDFPSLRIMNASLAELMLPEYTLNISAEISSFEAVHAVTNVSVQAAYNNITTSVSALSSLPIARYRTHVLPAAAATASMLNGRLTNATLHALRAVIETLPLGSAIDTVRSMQPLMDDLRDVKAPLASDGAQTLGAMVELVQYQLPRYSERLSRTPLTDMLQSGGASALINEVVGVITDFITFLATSQSLIHVQAFDLIGVIAPFTTYLDYAGGLGFATDSANHGAAYYYGMIVQPSRMMDANDPATKTILTDTAGRSYEDKKFCLSDACIQATLSSLSALPLEQWTSTHASRASCARSLADHGAVSACIHWAPALLPFARSRFASLQLSCPSTRWLRSRFRCPASSCLPFCGFPLF